MDHKKSPLGSLGFWLLWTITIAAGWLFIVYPGLYYRDMNFLSWSEIPMIAVKFFLMAFLLGLVVGIFQYGVLRFLTKLPFMWIIVSAVSYSVGSVLALLLSFLLIRLDFSNALSGSGETIVNMPLDFTMLLGGGLSGLIQVIYIKRYLETNQKRKILLWIFGSAVAWGLGFFATAFGWGRNWSINVQSGLGGVVIGAITGLIYLAILKKESFVKTQAAQSS